MRALRWQLGIALVVSLSVESTARGQTVLHRWAGPENGSGMGAAVAPVGDVDQDGFEDVMLGAPNHQFKLGTRSARGLTAVRSGRTGATLFRFVGSVWDNPNIGFHVAAGGDVNGDGVRDFLYSGSPTGYSASAVTVRSGLTGDRLYLLEGNYQLTPDLGTGIVGGVDLNLDGFADFVVTAPQSFGGGDGELYAYSGVDGSLLYSKKGFQGADGFGEALAALGDLDGDGAPEVVVGVPGSGVVQVRTGASGKKLYELTGSFGFGGAIAGVGDVDDDGLEDYVVGHSQANSNEGRAYVHSGADGALIRELRGSHPNAYFGLSVGGPGDLNGDGVPEVVVAAPYDDELVQDGGRVTVFSGADGNELMVLYGSQLGARLGASVAGAGDSNQGGLPDLMAGAPGLTVSTGAPGEVVVWASERPAGVYCTAKTNSLGCTPTIWSSGVPSLSGSTFRLNAYSVVNESNGALVWSLEPASVPWKGGFECVGRAQGRRMLMSGGNQRAGFPQPDCSGSFRDPWTSGFMASAGLGAGQSVYAQFLYEDRGDPSHVGMTDALSFDVLP